MSSGYVYIGCFIDRDELAAKLAHLDRTELACPVAAPHVTFSFRPDSADPELFGETVEVTVIGYGNNGSNEGLEVVLSSANSEIAGMIPGIRRPHITLSTAVDGRPYDTRFLDFSPVAPFSLTGIYGALDDSGVIRLN